MKHRREKYSIKKRVLAVLMGTLIPLLLFLMFLNGFIIQELNKKIMETSDNTLYIQIENLGKTLLSIENAMVSIITNDPSFFSLAYGGSTEFDDYEDAFEVSRAMENMMYPYSEMSANVLISVPKGTAKIRYNINIQPDEYDRQLLETIRKMVASDTFVLENRWKPLKVGTNSYIIRILGYRQTYLIGIINLDDVILMQNNVSNEATTVFYDEEGIYTGEALVTNNKIKLQGTPGSHYSGHVPQKYLVVEKQLRGSKLMVAYITSKVSFVKNLSFEHGILLLLSLLTLTSVPLGQHLLKKLFFGPLDTLVGTMELIRDEQHRPVTCTQYREIEFQKVEDTMFSMVEEIKNLKIASYEKELQMNRIQLQFFQVQIKPHFYLNCLKNIYGMVTESQSDEIQRMIILLSKHLRYMFQEEQMSVPINKELEYIRNYIELQQINMKYPPICNIECDEELLLFEMPGVSLLSIVENSVKHAVNIDKGLQIRILIQRKKIDDETVVYMHVSDNGQGYEEKIMNQLNFHIHELAEEGHLGIYNIVQRYKLFYGKEKVEIVFSNYLGASTEFFLRSYSEEESYGTTHCG